MRRVNRGKINPPVELSSTSCSAHLALIIRAPDTKVRSDYYRGRRRLSKGVYKYTVVEALAKLYNYKCAYCERSAHSPIIDHHRPSGKVIDADPGNQGYYWLAYEWTNLIPSCPDCNGTSRKGSKYPIKGKRNNAPPLTSGSSALQTAMLSYDCEYNRKEKPLLLHPEYCYPRLHFSFDINGEITHNSERGRHTILTLDLGNKDLNGWRRSIYQCHYNELSEKVDLYLTSNNPITPIHFNEMINTWASKLMSNKKNPKLEYTLFRENLLENYERFFVDPFPSSLRPTIKNIVQLALLSLGHKS